MDNGLDVLDRATMTTWRVSNYTLWSGVALLAAIVFHQVVDQFMSGAIFPTWAHVGSIDQRPMSGFGDFWFWAPRYGVYAGVALIVGLLIAAVVTRKVHGHIVGVAAAAAAVYVVIASIALQKGTKIDRILYPNGLVSTRGTVRHGLPSGAVEWSYAAVGLLAIAVAAGTAALVVRHRAKKLSRGTL